VTPRSGDAFGRLFDLGRRADGDDLAPPLARAGAEVDHPVGRPDRVFVVLDHDDGVALVAEGLERAQELGVVAGMQPDRGLVEHVQHAGEPGPDLGGQPDPLALAAGERGGLAVERQIAEAHLVEEGQPTADLLHQLRRDHLLRLVEHERREKLPGVGDRQGTERVEGELIRRERGGDRIVPFLPGECRGEALARSCGTRSRPASLFAALGVYEHR